MICICINCHCEVNYRPLKQLNLGAIDILWLNFVRDRGVLIALTSV